MDAMRLFNKVMSSPVTFQTQVDIEYGADLELLPALPTDVDHAAVHTHPFSLTMVTPGWWQNHSFHSHVLWLLIHMAFEPPSMVLRLGPQTPSGNLSMPDALKDLGSLPVWHQAAYPHHLSCKLWTAVRLIQFPSSVEGEIALSTGRAVVIRSLESHLTGLSNQVSPFLAFVSHPPPTLRTLIAFFSLCLCLNQTNRESLHHPLPGSARQVLNIAQSQFLFLAHPCQ
jgi:hypothetical protein